MITKLIKNLKSKRGFTLVELLVSVAIFAVIISPLLHAFITAQRTSARSHFLGDATLAAGNIIETIKAMGIADFIIDNGVSEINNNETPGGSSYTYEFLNYSDGIMSTFDIRLILNTDGFDVINDMEITNYFPMHGIFAQSAVRNIADPGVNPDILAAIDLADRATIQSGTPHSVELVLANYSREILIRVHINEAGNEARITATYLYSYSGHEFEWEPDEYLYRERICTDTCDNSNCIRCVNKSVYVFFQPLYFRDDEIIINNNAGMNLTLFLVAQHWNAVGEPTYNPVISGQNSVNIFTNADGGDLVSQTARNRIYRATIEVYARGTFPINPLEADDIRPLLRTWATQLD
jgi:prepilin-type N-terminal cleavage/methylation domain-containing protein